jgi:hypothetical protein
MKKWARKGMRDISNTELPVSLQMHKFIDGNDKPYTAFIGISDRQWDEFVKAGATNLEPLKENIILLVEGHEPTAQDEQSAKRMFANLYNSVTPDHGRR